MHRSSDHKSYRDDNSSSKWRLSWSPRSPYVRIVMVMAQELGLADRIMPFRKVVNILEFNAEAHDDTPLGKIPALQLEDDEWVYDTRVICDLLRKRADGDSFDRLSEAQWRRYAVLSALGIGLIDLALLRLGERLRPDVLRWEEIERVNHKKCEKALDYLEARATQLSDEPTVNLISIAVALSYFDFRFADDQWRNGRPELAHWYSNFSKLPSLLTNDFVDEPKPALEQSTGSN